MALSVSTFRGLALDMSKLELGDVLNVRTVHGVVMLLPCTSHDWRGVFFRYAARPMLEGDKKRIEDLKRANPSIHAIDGYGSLANGSVSAYVRREGIRLDCPLRFDVEIRWEDDYKGRERSRTLGKFTSVGGTVLEVTGGRLPGL